jgi:glycosyltransferase involved in cell wall biosynthesis
MAHYTRQTLGRADAVHTDCRRDARLSHDWGYPAGKPHLVLPGGGGVQLDVFYPAEGQIDPRMDMTPVVIQPRGVRAYVRNDTFFKAIPIVLEHFPQTRFVCTTMLGEPEAERWLAELGIADSVELLPLQTRAQMAELFRRAWVAVSPTTHDGTPNTLLEAMACGCFPVVGDIEPLREWIVPGVNGLLVDPGDPDVLAQAIISAVGQPELRAAAEKYNTRLIQEKAEFKRVMHEAEGFYRSLIAR